MFFWKNGQFIDEHHLTINVLDDGLSFSDTFRTYHGKVVLFNEHYSRLCQALNRYKIKMPYSTIALQEAIGELVLQDEGEDGLFHLIVLAGNEESHTIQTAYHEPNVILLKQPFEPQRRGTEKSAKWLETPFSHTGTNSQFISYKYNKAAFEKLEIDSLDCDEGFFLTERGIAANSVTSNIFWVKDGIIYTPSLSVGFTPTITRQWVIYKATQMGYRVIEGLYFKQELESTYECFTVNPIDELVPISNIGPVQFLGNDGPVYQMLHQAYIEEIIQTIKRSAY